MGSTGGVAAAVRLLEAGVAALSDVDVEALSDGQQLALVRVVHPLVCRMEAQRSRVIGSVHRRGAVFADGAVSTGAWLRSRLRMSDGQAQVRAAAAVRQVPELVAAGAGKLLAEQATQLAPGPLRHAAIHIRDHFDPDAAQRRARQRLEERWLSVARTFDGAVAVQGVLDPDGGELLLNTLTALMPPPVPHDPRSPACRSPPAPPAGWPATPPSSRRCSAAPRSRWTWAGRPGWSAPPNAAPSSCATRVAASPAATALHNGPTPTTWCPGPTAAPPTSTTSSRYVGGTTPRSTKAAGPSTSTPSPTPSPQHDPTANHST